MACAGNGTNIKGTNSSNGRANGLGKKTRNMSISSGRARGEGKIIHSIIRRNIRPNGEDARMRNWKGGGGLIISDIICTLDIFCDASMRMKRRGRGETCLFQTLLLP